MDILLLGPFIKDVLTFSRFLIPPPPFVIKRTLFTNPLKMTYTSGIPPKLHIVFSTNFLMSSSSSLSTNVHNSKTPIPPLLMTSFMNGPFAKPLFLLNCHPYTVYEARKCAYHPNYEFDMF